MTSPLTEEHGTIKRMTTPKHERYARKTLGLQFKAVSEHRGSFFFTYFSSVIFVTADSLLAPLFLSQLVDALIAPQHSHDKVYGLLWILIAVAIGSFLLGRLTFAFRNKIITDGEKAINMMMFDAFVRQEYSFYTNNFVGSLVSKSQRFSTSFKTMYDDSLFAMVTMVVQFVGSIAILTNRSPQIALVFLVVAAVMSVVIFVTNPRKRPILRTNSAAGSVLTGALADLLTNDLAVKIFSAGKRERQRFLGVAEHRRKAFFDQTIVNERQRAIRAFVSASFSIVATVILVNFAFYGRISIGVILLAQLYLARLSASLWDLSRLSDRVEEAMADSAEMTELILREPLVQDQPGCGELEVRHGAIDFRGVSFQYSDGTEGDSLFDGLSFSIRPGEKIGLVGPSGGGKSTITKLLLRFMDIQSGIIAIDDQSIDSVSQSSLREAIAYVPQEPLLFHRSVSENIGYGAPKASAADIEQAARLAHAHEFISKLPQGYDTLVGERGVKLSGGEKQRVAIARAMLKDAPIVVLDEATSALDSKSEKAIVSALDNLMKGRTTVVIAHRLSTIRKLDRILVLENGRVVEDGSHDALLKKPGLYAELWRHQSGEFLVDDKTD